MAEVVELSTSREVWVALENTFSHRSKAREIRLKDDLQLMKRGTRSVSEYARAFKALCNQLHAIGRPVDGTDEVHWFLRGLGSEFSCFSTAQMALTLLPCFADLVPKAESFEIFQKSLEPTAPSPTTFTATNRNSARSNQRSSSSCNQPTHISSNGRGKGHSSGRRLPRCQICRVEGHYANLCQQWYDRHGHTPEA